MPLQLKKFSDFFNLIIGKFQKEVPEIDATIKGSLARASSGASAVAGVGIQEGIADVNKQAFWQTSDDDFLELTGEYDKTVRFSAQTASGQCAVEGVLNTLISLGTQLNAQGFTYRTLQDTLVQTYLGDVSLTFSGGIVTAITSAQHSLATGIEVVIANAVQSEYNGTFKITVLDNFTFTYEITAGVLTSDNGDYTSVYALLDIESDETGINVNLSSGATLSISVIDIDDTAYVLNDGIEGGLEEEDIEAYRVRVGESHTLTPGIATIPTIKFSAKKVEGNTRVFVFRGQNTSSGTPGTSGYIPSLGETVVYILRDNDVNIIPSSTKLAETKQQILDDNIWTTLVPESNLYLLAPILVEENFTFSSITPNTATMQNAIRDQLDDFFRDNAMVGLPSYTVNLTDIESFLRQVQDSTGAILQAFTLDSPSGDLVAGSGEIYAKGTVSFI
jgi:uncharacterized phage protein gp47/JayE